MRVRAGKKVAVVLLLLLMRMMMKPSDQLWYEKKPAAEWTDEGEEIISYFDLSIERKRKES